MIAGHPVASDVVVGPDFIGLGAQRAGTSWLYACLYDHPEVHVPTKEIHFFSRARHWSRGYDWYDEQFADCPPGAIAGELSTSYLADPRTPARIRVRYPDAKLVVSLRHPVERAYSSYLNDTMAGVVRPGTSFADALRAHPEYVGHGRYFTQLARYLALFPRPQLLVLVIEDAAADPVAFVQRVFRFLDVDDRFVPSMVAARVNEGRVPYSSALDRTLARTSDVTRRLGLGRVWWAAKKAGLGVFARRLNTRREKDAADVPPDLRRDILHTLAPEIDALAGFLRRDLAEWRT